MTDLPPARQLLLNPPTGPIASPVAGSVTLGYDQRILRRKRLSTDQGDSFLVDFPSTRSLDGHWGLLLDDGRAIQVHIATEPLLEIFGDLPRLAWHIGNRHTPAQIRPDRIVIRADHVLEGMLTGLGAHIHHVSGPFVPEGGAYGQGRVMGHDHGGGEHADPGPTGHGPADTGHSDTGLSHAGQSVKTHDHGHAHLHVRHSHVPKPPPEPEDFSHLDGPFDP